MRDLRRTLVVMAFVVLALLVGCGGTPSTPTGGTGGTGTGSSGSGTGTGSSAVSVSMKNFAFVPSDINVAVGGTVTFTNDDSTAHTVTGDTFDSGSMAPGATFSQTFPTAGTFPIRCTVHPSMTGSVTVK